VGLKIQNSGAGQQFPTYVNPEMDVVIALLNGERTPVLEGTREWRIARNVENRGGTWIELTDTRIAAGSRTFLRASRRNGARPALTPVRRSAF
jgi:hypothetical protein